MNKMKARHSMSTMTRVFAFLFALVIAVVVIWNLNSDLSVVTLLNNQTTGDDSSATTQLYIGKQVSYTGKLVKQTLSFDYTHELTISDGTIIGLKSSTINLDRFSGNVEVNGSISAMKNAMIIISVAGAQAITVQESVVTGVTITDADDNKKIFFPKIGIYANISSPTMYDFIEKEGKYVLTHLLSGKDIITISHFVCQKNDPTKDCLKIINDMSPDGTPSFVSSQGNKYYKVLESTSTRFTTVDNLIGYYLTIPDEMMFTQASSQLSFLDASYIQRHLLKNVDKVCSTSTNSLVQIDKTTLSLSNGSLKVTVKGKNDIGSGTTCMLDLQSSNNEPTLMLTALSVEGATLKSSPSTGTVIPPTPSIPTGNVTTNQPVDEPSVIESPTNTSSTSAPTLSVDTGKVMIYKTSRGYTITFPSRAIYYEMETTDTDLGVPGLFCNVKINVGHYKDAEIESVEPAVEVYECRTKLEPESIEDLIYKQSLDGKKLFIKVNNATRKSFAEGIIVE